MHKLNKYILTAAFVR